VADSAKSKERWKVAEGQSRKERLKGCSWFALLVPKMELSMEEMKIAPTDYL